MRESAILTTAALSLAGLPWLLRPGAPDWFDLAGLALGLALLAPLLASPARALAAADAGLDAGGTRLGLPLFLAGCGLGLILFVQQVGMAVAWPGASEWISSGDRLQHQLGWEYYRRSAWAWPPGLTTEYPHPVGTSVVYTDSLPLLAMPLKAVSPWLPTEWQYLGLALLLAWVLQAGTGAALAHRAGLAPAASLAAAGLFALQPVLAGRIMHASLTWHWLLLAGLLLLLRDASPARHPPLRGWLLLCAAASLVHPYLAVMVLALLAVFALSMPADATTLRRRGRVLLAGGGLALLGWYVSGAFALRSVGALAGVELGEYASNLLAPFDSGGTSRWLDPLPLASHGQYEGRAYPGAGGWLLLLAAALMAWRHRQVRARLQTRTWFWLGLLALAAAAFAVGPRPALGSWILFDLSSWTPRVLEIFHAAGRFAWIPLYVALAAALVAIAARPRTASWLLALAFLLQAAELLPSERIGERLQREGREMAVPDPLWVDRLADRRQLVLLPARLCGGPPIDDLQAARLALRHSMTINSAYLARYDGRALRADCEGRRQALLEGQWDEGSVYVLGEPLWSDLRQRLPSHVDCLEQDGHAVCITAGSSAAGPEAQRPAP